MSSAPAAACISVLMPAYNAERYILPSILSVLAQTFEDFELLVVDDCSTDRTPDILASIQDPRLRVLRNEANLGIVGSLNRAMAEARGRCIARIDADDYCLPTRFAKQKRYLDEHPDILLVGAGTFILEDGHVRHERRRADPDPAVLRWQCLVRNPVGHPTMMFRADAVAALGTYLREGFKYAEDFDFSHRLLRLGDLAVLPEDLVIYRLHQQNLTRTRRTEMIAKAAAVLAGAYAALLGGDRAAEATLVAEHLMAGEPVRSLAALERLGALLDQLVTAFVAAHALSEDQTARVIAHAGEVWWAVVQASLRAGVVIPAALGHGRFRWSRESRPPLHRIARSAVSGLVGHVRPTARQRDASPQGASSEAPNGADARLGAVGSHPDSPPSLYAVVDAAPRSDASVAQDQAQAIFDGFGLRPVYLVDLAGASQAESCEPLRRILERHGCAIGVRLHPWANPPSGPAELQERTLRALVSTIQANFGVSPLFFVTGIPKAGGYGLGPRALDTLAQLGFAASASIPAAADPAAGGFMSRLGLADTVTLTADGGSARAQTRLVRAMAGRGSRLFALHCRSPSPLVAGSAPQAATSADLRWTEAICRFFFEDLGGMPGNPADLVPQQMRERAWPRPEQAGPMVLPGAIMVPSGE